MTDRPEEPDSDRPDQPRPAAIPPVEHDETGLELARTIARGLAGKTPGRRRTSLPREGRRTSSLNSPAAGAAGPDERDPQTLDSTMSRMIAERGWETELRVHGVFSRWEAIVGHEIGQHTTPESYADGRLVCRTDSTAWATQLRLLAPGLLKRLNEILGDGTVTIIEVIGPHAPSWRRGRLRVKGRGPRDTYG